MRIRIPTRINRVLDAAQRHPRLVVAVTAGLMVAWPLAVLWASPLAAVIVAAGLLLYVVTALFTAHVVRLRETIRQQAYDLAAKDARIAALSEGDPLAPTAQFRSIGESGELT